MAIAPKILFAHVMHKRLFPQINAFAYGIYYLYLPLEQLKNIRSNWLFGINRRAIISFYSNDHGAKNDDPEEWARNILAQHNITSANGRISLICMPRVFGYVFNPVSFWLCHDDNNNVRAILCEVNNTFGETHTYLCAHDDQRIIGADDELTTQKIFHVSPFLPRNGHYTFRFNLRDDGFAANINYFDNLGEQQLLTSLIGKYKPLNQQNLIHAFWRYPLVTLRAIYLIHWQALRLLTKRATFFRKPVQLGTHISTAQTMKKM